MKISLATKISDLGKIGKATASRFKKIGINDIADLLFHFPIRYDDYSKIIPISKIKQEMQVTIKGKVEQINQRRSWKRRRMSICEAVIADETGSIKAIWFNQFYVAKILKQGDIIFLSGKAKLSRYGLQLASPNYEKITSGENIHTASLVPIYPTTLRLTQKQIRYLTKICLPLAKNLDDYLPFEIMEKEKLLNLKIAIQQIHFPKNKNSLKNAKNRLKFDELFLIQLTSMKSKFELLKANSVQIKFKKTEILKFVEILPFRLTNAQRKVTWEIIQDQDKQHPTNRLLEGDVGSGKTVVAAIAMLNAALNDYQSCIMVPTEILAWQHFLQLAKLYKKQHLHIAVLTNSLHHVARGINASRPINKKRILEEINEGKIKIIIGTHSLIQEKVNYKNLGFCVIDEQHRFGVEQRKKLVEKSGNKKTYPHFLSMTATPIPRSLSLTIYGDLDLSIIDELPKGRKKIETRIVESVNREKAYEFIRLKIKQNEQVFVICPLIEESDKLGVKSVKKEYEKLSNQVFKEFNIGLMHGKLNAKDKEKIMQEFKDNKIQILISTSVVEVGVDVPNATIMIIEDAQRFGLAQLHQFRGRVGRGDKKSYCFLFSESENDITQKRLQAIVESNNGFELAQKDLELRGSGEMYGVRQSGIPTLKLASLLDIKNIKKTREWAKKILEQNPSLNKYSSLQKKIIQSQKKIHFE